jgi:hypothetical protein
LLHSRSYAAALVYAGLGETDRAFEWLDRAYEDRMHWLVMLRIEPQLDSLRTDPHFAALLRRLGLEEINKHGSAQGRGFLLPK